MNKNDTYILKKTEEGNIIMRCVENKKLYVVLPSREYLWGDQIENHKKVLWLSYNIDGGTTISGEFKLALDEATKMANDMDVPPCKVEEKKNKN